MQTFVPPVDLCLKLALLFLKFLATLTGWKRRGRCYRVEEERGREKGKSKRKEIGDGEEERRR